MDLKNQIDGSFIRAAISRPGRYVSFFRRPLWLLPHRHASAKFRFPNDRRSSPPKGRSLLSFSYQPRIGNDSPGKLP